MKTDPNRPATDPEELLAEPQHPPTKAERIEELMLVGSLDAAGIRAKLLEEGLASRVSLAAVEREMAQVRERWHAAAVTRVGEAVPRQLARCRDLYARALAVADSADSPKVVLAALTQAGRFNDTEARLLGISDRHLQLGWLAQVEKREAQDEARELREQWRAEAAEQAARELAEQEAKAAAHRAEWGWWERTDEELLGRIKGVLSSSEKEALERLAEATEVIRDIGEYGGELIVLASDPWQPELAGRPVEPEEIDDPRTLWSALVRAELSDADPPALERALAAIADYPLPPRWEPEALEPSPATTRIREQELEERTEALFQERLLRELAGQAGTPGGSDGGSEPN